MRKGHCCDKEPGNQRVAENDACCRQGGDCFAAFMQWGLPKGNLKDIWAVVAGDNGQLTEQQFLACLYLMDQAKRGIPPPASLPPGPFPPISTAAPSQPPWQQLSRQASRVSSDGGAPQGFSLDAVQRVSAPLAIAYEALVHLPRHHKYSM